MLEVRQGIGTYSLSKDGNEAFSINGKPSNFRVKEFACKDGSDEILIDGDLVRNLQKIRNRFGTTTINSAYRTPLHNAKVGGAPKSQHVQGRAADIVCKNGTPLEVAMYAETLGMGGIGFYSSFTHVDTRSGKARWDSRSGKETGVSTFLTTLFYGNRGDKVLIARKLLNMTAGAFDDEMLSKVKAFQREKGLEDDGIIGVKTWTELFKNEEKKDGSREKA